MPDPYVTAVSGALVAVAIAYHQFLLGRIKRGEDREERRDKQFDRLADLIEAALGVKVPRGE